MLNILQLPNKLINQPSLAEAPHRGAKANKLITQ